MAQSAYQTLYQFPSQHARPAAFGGGHGQPHFQQQQPPPGGPGHNPAAAYQPPGSLPPGLQTPEAFAYHDGVGGTTTAPTNVIQTTGVPHHPGGPYAHQQQHHSPANASPQPQQPQHFAPDAALAQRQQQQYHAQQQQQQQQQRNQGLQQQQQTQQQTPSAAKFPMAAPPLPVSPANAPSQQQQQQQAVRGSNNNGALSPATPQSPGAQSRDQQRISLLFDINVQLLQEVNRLQSEGQGGAINPAQQATLRSENKPDKMASEQYIQCLRRVQANLGYLMPKAQTNAAGDHQQQAAAATKTPPGPAHMTPPPHMPQLMPLYERLRELFPGWQGIDHRMSSSSSLSAVGAASSPRSSVGGGIPNSTTGAATAV